MINKKSLWFLTLFSLILVLSVYYITMPPELLLSGKAGEKLEEKSPKDGEVVSIKESEVFTALRVEANDQLAKSINDLRVVLTSVEASVEDKNNAYEKMKLLNLTKGEEEKIEQKILTELKLKSFVKIDGDQVRVVVASEKHSNENANEIMRLVQSQFSNKMFISVKFQK